MNNKVFNDGKKKALEKLNIAKKQNLVDKKIIPIIDKINKNNDFFTSSCCSGRIVLLELPELGDKKNAVFLGKWHKKIKKTDILEAIEKTSNKDQMWLLAQPPIIHVFSKNIESANLLIKTGIASGFKHSSFKLTQGNIIVEICSTERLDFPIGKKGVLLCSSNHLDFLIEISNNIINRSDIKLSRLEKLVIENF